MITYVQLSPILYYIAILGDFLKDCFGKDSLGKLKPVTAKSCLIDALIYSSRMVCSVSIFGNFCLILPAFYYAPFYVYGTSCLGRAARDTPAYKSSLDVLQS